MQALGLVWGDIDSISPDSNEISTPKDAPAHPGAKRTFESWQQKCQFGGFVVGRDLPSRALVGVLRNLAICEPVNDGADYRMRVAGTGLVRRYGCDVTGLLLSQLYESRSFKSQHKAMAQAANGAALFFDVQVVHAGRVELQYESLLLPVLSPDFTKHWVMGGIFYPDWAR